MRNADGVTAAGTDVPLGETLVKALQGRDLTRGVEAECVVDGDDAEAGVHQRAGAVREVRQVHAALVNPAREARFFVEDAPVAVGWVDGAGCAVESRVMDGGVAGVVGEYDKPVGVIDPLEVMQEAAHIGLTAGVASRLEEHGV